jgi:hypothetical protein
MKNLIFILVLLINSNYLYAQVVTNQKEAERLYSQSLIESKRNKLFLRKNISVVL